MSENAGLSEEILNAFVDGQLDEADSREVARRVESDAALREEVRRLRALKGGVRRAYASLSPGRDRKRRLSARGWVPVAAACLLFGMAGWFAHAHFARPATLDSASAYALRGDWRGLQGGLGELDAGKVLVHVSASGGATLEAALQEMEDLLRESRQERRAIELEIVANGPGLDLLGASDNPFAQRLAALRRDYPGVSLVACGQTLERRTGRGQPIELVTGTRVATSALHRIVERLREGWVYVRV